MKVEPIKMVENLYRAFESRKQAFKKIEDYYIGKTDAILNYTKTDRNNLKVSCNYLKKFIKEEVAYSVGNPITYTSKSGDFSVAERIDLVIDNFPQNHDVDLFTNEVLFGIVYEVRCIDKHGRLKVKCLKPTEAYHEEDHEGDIEYFIHVYDQKEYDEEGVERTVKYIDYYTDENVQIYRYDTDFSLLNVIPHYFDEIPVGMAKISNYIEKDTLYSDIKTIQDAIETNLSDVVNEISDFRNAYLVITGLTITDSEAEKFKTNGIIEVPDTEGKAEWLIKEINDTFVQNTLKNLQEKIYEITSHINHNDAKILSNASGIALKSRMIALMQRCDINEGAFQELVLSRLRVISKYLQISVSKGFDIKDVNIKFTPMIPSDDATTAEMLRSLDGKLSLETGLSLLSFVEDGKLEAQRLFHETSRKDALKEVINDVRSRESFIAEYGEGNGEFAKILNEKSKLEGATVSEFATLNTSDENDEEGDEDDDVE